MQNAETVLDVLRERGRKGLPLEGIYRQLFNPQLYLLAYGRIYSNKVAMTPGPDADGPDHGILLRSDHQNSSPRLGRRQRARGST